MTSSAAERASAEIPSTGSGPAVIGLRERKKIRTRATIRSEAIRLFVEQGYANTTVEQIAEAADVSPSTFFRYFPTKEAVIITDEFDPLIFQEFRDQPAEESPIRAFRNSIRTVFGTMNQEAVEQEHVRQRIMQSVPELRSAMLEEFGVSLRLLAAMIGERIGRPADDKRVQVLAGAMIGVVMSVTLSHWNRPGEPVVPQPPDAMDDMVGMAAEVDEALELLELGLPL